MLALRSIACLTLLVLLAGRAHGAEPPTPLPPAPPGVPTLWLVGDSTVHNGTRGELGWGEPLAKLFDPAKVRVVNRAIGGRSSRTIQTEGRWDAVLAEVRPGDVVLIQFGHNDGGPLIDATRSRGSLRGTGEESKEVTLNDGRHETVHTFGWYLKKYVADARAKGATPVVCSWVPHCPKVGEAIGADPKPASYRAAAPPGGGGGDHGRLHRPVQADLGELHDQDGRAGQGRLLHGRRQRAH